MPGFSAFWFFLGLAAGWIVMPAFQAAILRRKSA